jgi:hypothetical protein
MNSGFAQWKVLAPTGIDFAQRFLNFFLWGYWAEGQSEQAI